MQPIRVSPRSLLACLAIFATANAAGAEGSLNSVAWLSGCWSAQNAEPGSGEQWTSVAGASLLGMSRTVRQGKTVAYEFMRIAQTPEGKLAFIAQPSGRPPTTFPALTLSDTEATFENLEHDFPQRVSYRFQPPAGLLASIEGLRGGALKRVEFPMAKVSCDAQLSSPAPK